MWTPKNLSPETLHRFRRVGLNTGFGLLVFIVALYIWFPYGRAKEAAVAFAAAQGYDVEIESAGPAWGVGVSFSNIHAKTRPTKPGEKPTRFSIESASITTSVFSIIAAPFSSSPLPMTLSLDAFGGHLEITQEGTVGRKGPFSFELTARDLDLKELPGIREAINLPVSGTLRADVEIASATGKLATGKGGISFECTACTAGDGKSPMKIEAIPFLAGGLTLPKVRLGDVHGDVAIENGVGKLKGVEAKSPDIELSLEGDIQLRDPTANSIINLYLRFKPSDAFLKSAATLQTLLQMAGASGRRADGSYGVHLSGRFGAPTGALSPTSPLAGAAPPPRSGARPGIAPSYVPPPAAAPMPAAPAPADIPQPQPPPSEPVAAPPPAPPPPPAAPPSPPEPEGTLRGAPPPQPAPAPVADPRPAGPDAAIPAAYEETQ